MAVGVHETDRAHSVHGHLGAPAAGSGLSFEQVLKVDCCSRECELLLYPASLDGTGVLNPVTLIDAFP